jgi:hypothetical protein
MRSMFLAIGATALLGSAALADEVIVKQPPGVMIEKRATDESVTTKKVIHEGDGCATKSVTHTDADTDSSVTRTKSNC